jgi:PPK2 family polyphosphate:nucleotide phosphotransferase
MKQLLKGDILKRLMVPPGKKISLKRDYDPGEKLGLDRENATRQLEAGVKQLAELQDKLYAQDTRSVLVIFQAMDAAGKDGTIKHVMSGLNPQGCQVFSFKAPSSEELDHDYLWRCSKALPERGRIGIFNRSYYEEVLVVRVHPEILARQRLPEHLKGKDIWKRRYQEINNFERYLTDNGTTILKFFLNISKAEQKRRFLARIAEPEKNWKFSAADALERAHWDAYMKAYEDCLRHTSTKWAPWYVIPADFKPATRLAVAFVITETLREMGLHYPIVSDAAYAELARVKALLERE